MEGLLVDKGYVIHSGYKVVFEAPDDGYSYFFGYYDKTPLAIDNNKLLAHRVSFDGREVRKGDVAEVGFFDINSGRFHKIDETLAWNWQQGAQLQWLPGSHCKKIVFNTVLDGRYVAKICDIETREFTIVPFAIYAVHPNGKEALGINYERHYWCRDGYNYQCIENTYWDEPFHEDDGIFRIDLTSGESHRIISLPEIVSLKKLPEFSYCDSWLEHLRYSPSGNRFMFFHRWSSDGQDVSRVFLANSHNGEDLVMLPDNRFFSHYDWKSDQLLTIWTRNDQNKGAKNKKRNFWFLRVKKWIKSLIVKVGSLVGLNMAHATFNKSRNYSRLETFDIVGSAIPAQSERQLVGNGHQSWFEDGRRLLNDTYQDESGFRSLMIFDSESQTIDYVGKFYSQYNDCVYRCDLHPRLSADNKLIVIDSAHKSSRKMIVIAIGNA